MPSPSPDFKREILDAGFWYPPPTMFLALPIGLLAIHQAALLWYSLQLAALAASVLLLWRTFLPASGLAGLAGCGALVLLLRTRTLPFREAYRNAAYVVYEVT